MVSRSISPGAHPTRKRFGDHVVVHRVLQINDAAGISLQNSLLGSSRSMPSREWFRRLLPQQPRLWRFRRKAHGREQCRRAIAAYDHLIGLGVPAGRIAAYGESLGSGQAVRLAAEKPVAAVVLEAPLTSTVDVARTTYFWLPLGMVITDKYDNERSIRSVTAPVLILHGERDAVIPVEMGWRIYRAANEPKRIEVFPQGAHYHLFDHGAWEKTRAFLASPGG
jgi:fermentation-respiration switch protein FrsA (DUF1100 family)